MLTSSTRATFESLPPAPDAAAISAIFPADGATVALLFQTADERLYVAKREGRNRVVVSPPAARSAPQSSTR